MTDPQETIVIKAPAGTTARWAQAAERQGLDLSELIVRSVDLPANTLAQSPCHRCGSVLLVADGPVHSQCVQCGLAN